MLLYPGSTVVTRLNPDVVFPDFVFPMIVCTFWYSPSQMPIRTVCPAFDVICRWVAERYKMRVLLYMRTAAKYYDNGTILPDDVCLFCVF
jgi:hypothetical protein